MRLTFVQ